DLLGLKDWKPRAGSLSARGQTDRAAYRMHTFSLATEGLAVRLIAVEPPWPDDSSPIVVRVGGDHQAELAAGGVAETLARQGRRVVLADLRGMGERAPRSGRDRADSPLGPDVREAFLSLHIGRPLLGQRTADLLDLLDTLRAKPLWPGHPSFDVVGIGPAGLA